MQEPPREAKRSFKEVVWGREDSISGTEVEGDTGSGRVLIGGGHGEGEEL